MIYQDEIKRILKNFYYLKSSIEIMTEKIEEIECDLDGFRGMSYEGMPTAKNKPSSKMEALIIERDNIKDKIRRTNDKIVLIENAMNKLKAKERFVIEAMYLGNEAVAMKEITEALNLNKSKIYRLKDQAIHNLSVLYFGLDAI